MAKETVIRDKEIVQINYKKIVQKFVENIVHKRLENRRSIGETERNIVLEETVRATKSRLPFITIFD
eukprot:Awhi_evm1s14741